MDFNNFMVAALFFIIAFILLGISTTKRGKERIDVEEWKARNEALRKTLGNTPGTDEIPKTRMVDVNERK